MTAETIAYRIILEKPVPGLAYGIQSGSGNDYKTLHQQAAQSGDLVFDFAMPVKKNKEGAWVWHGPIMQGPPGNRFLYLGIGSYAGRPHRSFNGRLKIPLPDLSIAMINSLEKRGIVLARIAGVNEKTGKPTMATIQPIDGWQVIDG